jgi:hypothetical protein
MGSESVVRSVSELDSALPAGEPSVHWRSPDLRMCRQPMARRDWVRPWERSGGWRRKVRKATRHEAERPARREGREEPERDVHRAGVRAPIGVRNPGNAGGAKGCEA